MNKPVVAGIAVFAFFVGEGIGCVRTNKYWRKKLNERVKIEKMTRLKADALDSFLTDMANSAEPEQALEHFVDNLEFMRVVEEGY